jgi:hypothetical protein
MEEDASDAHTGIFDPALHSATRASRLRFDSLTAGISGLSVVACTSAGYAGGGQTFF